jgi:hypothetical protein
VSPGGRLAKTVAVDLSHVPARSIGIASGVLAVTGGGLSQWHRMATWGSTEHEASAVMPGDEIIGEARYRSTHAITIETTAEDVWPWLVQMGQGRGGLYSYDWLENLLGLDIHSAGRIDASLQTLSVGDVVRLVPEGSEPPLRFVVARMHVPTLLVLGPDTSRDEAFAAHLPYPCWTFQLTPTRDDTCRLVVRFQADFQPTLLGRLAYQYALLPIHFVMERKMMLGIKARAERNPHRRRRLAAVPA